tara:strand:+ start:12649 stop:13251 length:603 start_codon:yes stop_codon:yes gene_type:complete
MTFWSTQFKDDPTLRDPKRKFRFKVTFTGLGDAGGVLWYAKSAEKPSFAIAQSEHKYLNHTFYYPGSVTWNPVTIIMVDPVKPDMAASMADIINAGGYTIPTTNSDLTTMSKAKAASALGQVMVTQIDSNGTEIEAWTLKNAFIVDLKFGDLAYGADELTELTIQLRYDWATLDTTNTDGSDRSPAGAQGPTEVKEFFKN